MKNRKEIRDTFAFSLGGMTAITSFTAAPAIADDRIRQFREEFAQKKPDCGVAEAQAVVAITPCKAPVRLLAAAPGPLRRIAGAGLLTISVPPKRGWNGH